MLFSSFYLHVSFPALTDGQLRHAWCLLAASSRRPKLPLTALSRGRFHRHSFVMAAPCSYWPDVLSYYLKTQRLPVRTAFVLLENPCFGPGSVVMAHLRCTQHPQRACSRTFTCQWCVINSTDRGLAHARAIGAS